MGKSKAEWLKESDYWDSLSFEELMAMSEPADWRPIDARPKKSISLRLTESLIERGKEAAAEKGIGYQTLFRMWIIEGLTRHRLAKLEETAGRKRRTA
ncbi:MAG TPA: CopG family antitoxin [Dehalococcoidia bacterium]|jgi:predicted DNA binding CopG/RHH family protein|nr:CopG family antitoxin [Dehalococcoidia bacterium]